MVAHDGRIKPERSDDQRERPCGRLLRLPWTPPRRTSLPVVPQMSGASSRSRNQRFRRLERSEWSGARSNCRPSAFQPVFPLPRPFPRRRVKAQLTHVTAGQWTNAAMLPLFRPGPPTSVLSVGFLCQHAHSQPLCGHSVGPEPQPASFRAPADRSRSLKACGRPWSPSTADRAGQCRLSRRVRVHRVPAVRS